MSKRIVLNPVTRISGFLELDVFIENNRVVEAKTGGLLFRGFEKMLVGRSPLDAVYFTQRICGICSTAHSIASTLALESAMKLVPSEQGRYLRDIIHCCEFLQNHIRHFYQYTVPDFVKLPGDNPLFYTEHKDFRLPKTRNDVIVTHYFDSLAVSRGAHEMLAVLGGKAPHNHGVFVGGITTQATADKIIKLKALLADIGKFINESMLPDALMIAQYYPEYYRNGIGYGNLLSYGCFYGYKELGDLYLEPLAYSEGRLGKFDPSGIGEDMEYSWYSEAASEPAMNKPAAYSWVKAARYNGVPFETGPLARMWLSGGYNHGISTMDRIIARVMEAQRITDIMELLLDNLIPETTVQQKYDIPDAAIGTGLTDTTRGALGHWLHIENKAISFYQIITPSGWNLSTRSNGMMGTAERALAGSYIADEERPVELGRIIRSFDPCVSCATHVYSKGRHINTIKVIQ